MQKAEKFFFFHFFSEMRSSEASSGLLSLQHLITELKVTREKCSEPWTKVQRPFRMRYFPSEARA